MRTPKKKLSIVCAVLAFVLVTGVLAHAFGLCPTVTCRMIREGVRNVNNKAEYDQYTEDTHKRVYTNPWLLYNGGGDTMDNVKNLQQPRGLPPDEPKKAKEAVNEGRGGWFGYGGQISDIVKASKTETPGEKTQEETKAKGGDKGKQMEPAIIPADHPSFTESVAAANILVAQTVEIERMGGSRHQSAASAANSTMYESSGANKNDNIAALMTLMAPIWEEEQKKQEERKRTVESAAPQGMPGMQSLLGPSETLQRIAQDGARAARLKHEISLNTQKLMELRATKVQLLARLTAMEGEIFTDRVNTALRERGAIFDAKLYELSTHRGRKDGGK